MSDILVILDYYLQQLTAGQAPISVYGRTKRLMYRAYINRLPEYDYTMTINILDRLTVILMKQTEKEQAAGDDLRW